MVLGSEIRDPEKTIPDPGSRGQKGTGSRIRIRNTVQYYEAAAKLVELSKIITYVFKEELENF